MIRNSAETRLFRTILVEENGKKKDVAQAGKQSCAFFVSSILYLFQLIDQPHAMVATTIKKMEEAGWYCIQKPRAGSVLVWGPKKILGSVNRHIGFYRGSAQAISNDAMKGFPIPHHWTYGKRKSGKPTRAVEAIYWHKKLD